MTSPNYPNTYDPELYCIYNITTSHDRFINIHFIDFNFEKSPQCKNDNVTLYKETYDDSREEINSYCGEVVPRDERIQKVVDIILKTDSNKEYRGFKLAYSIDVCGGIIKKSQVIQPPLDHSNIYHSSMDCYWNITAPDGDKILIIIEDVSLEYHGSCNLDYLAVIRTFDINPNNTLYKICANNKKLPTIQIEDSKAILHFHTDSSVIEGSGFKATVLFTKLCNEKFYLNDDTPSITIHNISSGYENFLDCTYTAFSPPDTVIEIKFKKFHIATCDESFNRTDICSCDYIDVRDGMGISADLIGHYCGHNTPPILTTSRNNLWMNFVTDGIKASTGFEIELRMITSACGHSSYVVSKEHFTFLESPNDNSKYLNSINCNWKVKSEYSTEIEIEFEKFKLQDVDEEGKCLDYLEIITSRETYHYDPNDALAIVNGNPNLRYTWYSGIRNPPLRVQYCGSKIPENYISYGDSIEIKFFSNGDNNVDSGFKLKMSSNSGKSF